MKEKLGLMFSGFLQVFLVALNTYFISKGLILGIFLLSFLIAVSWSYNVKRVVFGSKIDVLLYAIGSSIGGVVGYVLGFLIHRLI
jgi:membrane protein YqaA with SNARE-associated domain